MKASPRLGHLRSFPALTLTAACALALACSSSSPGGGSGGSSGSGTGGSTTGSGGAHIGTGGSNTGAGGSNTGSGGTVSTGGSTGNGGSNTGSGGASATGGSTGTGGSNVGSGGATGAGGSNIGGHGGSNAGAGGSSNGGHGGSNTGTGGIVGAGGSTGGGGSVAGCPTNATFCSGFEDSTLPAGAVYNANAAPGDWSRDFAVDTTRHHSGNSSLRVKIGEAGATGAYQMLAVPATPTGFWARFWVYSSTDLGNKEHNAFAAASIGAGTNDLMIEFAEDAGIAFNTKDSDCWPTVGCQSQQPTTYYTVPGMTWQCVELSFNPTTQVQQAYINGTMVINAMNYPGSSVSSGLPYFKFGYDAYHPDATRQLWYDDVVVAPTRIGCQ